MSTGVAGPEREPGSADLPDLPDLPDLRMLPLAAASWAGSWFGTGGVQRQQLVALAVAVAVGLVMAAVGRWRRPWRSAAAALVLLGTVVVGGAAEHRLTSGPLSELAAAQAVVTVDLTIRADPQLYPAVGSRPAYLTVRAVAHAVDGRGAAWRIRAPVRVTVTGERVREWSTALVGSRVVVQGRLQGPDPGSDFAAVVRVRGAMTVTAPPSAGLRLVERVRAGLRASVAERRDEPRALVPALVLGDTSAMTPQITEDFRTTGLVHLTAVSGANLTLLLAFLLLMARWLGVRGRWLRVVGLLAVVLFVALCRTEPSVLRAAAMGLVALAALGAGGVRAGLRTLSVAMVALLLVDPYLSRSVGFALSVLASGGIVWWAGRWASILHTWMPRVAAESVAVPLAAHLATLPVVAAISGQVSVIGVLTNAVAGPLVGPATVLGFAAAGLSLVSSTAAALAGFGAAWSAQGIVWVAHLGARFPGSSWHWPVTPTSLAVLAAGSLLAGLVMPALLSRRWLVLVLALVLMAGVRSPLQPGWPPPAWVLVACDVGQGDALVLHVAEGQAMVVDAGPDPALVRRCLDELGIRTVAVLILTHFHSDHIDGVPGVFENRRVGQIWVSPWASPPAGAEQVRVEASRHQAPVRVPRLGEVGQLGELSWHVLGPVGEHRTATDDGESAAENDASLVVMVTVRGVRILLTGDVEPSGQQAILADGADLQADVLKLPHHGSGNQEPAFLAGTHARVAIASAGVDNDYGHPAPRTVRLVQSLGMTLLRTDEDGSVAVSSEGGRLSVTAQRRR